MGDDRAIRGPWGAGLGTGGCGGERRRQFGIGGEALERVETYGGAVVGREILAEAVLAES